jgi:hypothetical protein
MKAKLIAPVLFAAALGLAATDASAATVKCVAGAHGGYDREMFPVVYRLRAINLPKKTDGKASPCAVADFVAGAIQGGFADTEDLPTVISVLGPRWDAGEWICVYKEMQGEYVPYIVAKCHRSGKSFRKVTMELGS